jgi:hypothetical protein
LDKITILDFISKLSNESWVGVLNNIDVNLMFSYFLNTYPSLYIFSLLRFVIKIRNFLPQTTRLTIMVPDKVLIFIIHRLI